jgi:capsular polysaccharide biosynthesis protein
VAFARRGACRTPRARFERYLVDFRTFARTLATHWKLFIGALLVCLAGAAAVTAFQTKSYQSSATVLISFSGETDLVQVFNGTQTAQERLSSYAALAGGRAVAERAVNQLHVPITSDAFVNHTHVEFTPKSTLFTITVNDTDPKRAAALAGAMADSFAAMVATLGATPHPMRPAAPTTTGAAPTSVAPPTDPPTLPAAGPIGRE